MTALRAWTDAVNLTDGAIFRGINRHGQLLDTGMSHTTANRILQTRAQHAGLDNAGAYSILSLTRFVRDDTAGAGGAGSAHRTPNASYELATLSVYDRPEQALHGSPAQRLVEAMTDPVGGQRCLSV